MFCYQCQEAAGNTGCTVNGVCGKTNEVAALQDLLIYIAKGISIWSAKARPLGVNDPEVDLFIAEALFTTVTNVNFDKERMFEIINKALEVKNRIKDLFLSAYKDKNNSEFSEELHDSAIYNGSNSLEELWEKGEQVGVLACDNEDVRSLRELLVYGLKGIAAYADHAYVLNYENSDILKFLQNALVATTDDSLSADELVGYVLEAGKIAVDTMALLDKANTETFGHPEITEVSTGTDEGPAILISGHDLLDLEELLKQTENSGIKVYTHGEMLPANAYPELKKYPHLAGNYGSAWYNQTEEFDNFKGAILMTTNCLQKPKESYKDRIFTTGLVAWPGVKHIANRPDGGVKDFSQVIAAAKEAEGLKKIVGKKLIIGLAHQSALSVADKIVEAVKAGSIKKFVVMAGCDGRHDERKYFTDIAKSLPGNAVILTAGCAKFRYNQLDMGDIGGIPRVIDAGQCNDSYSLVVIALKLAEVFGVESVNDLPISYDIAWYEQKAVAVLLALLYLGVKGIKLGPSLPAFVSPNVLKVLVEKFSIQPITTVENDIKEIMA